MRQVNSLAGITALEKAQNERHVVLLLFVKPSDGEAASIIPQFNYLHHKANKYCSVYAAGFAESHNMKTYPDRTDAAVVNGETWQYSDLCFLTLVSELEQRLPSWKDTGESQLLMFQTNPTGREILNFQNYISIDLAHGLRNKYFESIPRLLAELISASRKEVTATTAFKSGTRRVRLKNVLEIGISESKIIPTSVQKLLKDEFFYRTSIKKSPANNAELKANL